MANGHGAQSKDDEPYAIPRRQGARKEQAASIVIGSRSRRGRRGGKSLAYDDRSLDGLSQRTEVRIRGRSGMAQGVLIAALHRHP